jgi:hypothetical protein
MAVFTRTNGDAAGVVQVDAGRSFANAVIINTGIAAPLGAYKIAAITGTGAGGANLAAELTVGGAVETILRAISSNATILAYQVDSTGQISLITERSAWSAADMQTVIRALPDPSTGYQGGNIGAVSNVVVLGATVSTTGGIKFA